MATVKCWPCLWVCDDMANRRAPCGSTWSLQTVWVVNAAGGTPQQAVDLMRPFVDAGVSYFMLEVLGLPDPK